MAELAKVDGAAVTLVYVSDSLPPMVYSDSTLGYGITQKDHQKACDAYAKDVFKKAAAALARALKQKCCISLIPIYPKVFWMGLKSQKRMSL